MEQITNKVFNLKRKIIVMVIYNMCNIKTGEIVASFTNKDKAKRYFISHLPLELNVISDKPRFYYDTDDNKTFFVHPVGKPTILVGSGNSEDEARKEVAWCNKHHF